MIPEKLDAYGESIFQVITMAVFVLRPAKARSYRHWKGLHYNLNMEGQVELYTGDWSSYGPV